ncbi:hypothetical protein IFM89_028305 [Coptis chinensis]|uniref:Uncharacterized protein n=1 Tax=Coptis chinensis TaxID=261450 RepID=A0A835HF39_9MAGN|nr:hypothetical protein IFM89_028305 [Coptis chinensis]
MRCCGKRKWKLWEEAEVVLLHALLREVDALVLASLCLFYLKSHSGGGELCKGMDLCWWDRVEILAAYDSALLAFGFGSTNALLCAFGFGVIFVHDLSQRRPKSSLQKWAAEVTATGTFSTPLGSGGPGGLPVPYIVIDGHEVSFTYRYQVSSYRLTTDVESLAWDPNDHNSFVRLATGSIDKMRLGNLSYFVGAEEKDERGTTHSFCWTFGRSPDGFGTYASTGARWCGISFFPFIATASPRISILLAMLIYACTRQVWFPSMQNCTSDSSILFFFELPFSILLAWNSKGARKALENLYGISSDPYAYLG